MNWAGGALTVALREGVGKAPLGAVGPAGTGTTGGGRVSVRRPLVGNGGDDATGGGRTEEMTLLGGRAEYMVEKDAGGAPVTVTVAVPHSQSSSDSPSLDGLPAAPPEGLAAPPVG